LLLEFGAGPARPCLHHHLRSAAGYDRTLNNGDQAQQLVADAVGFLTSPQTFSQVFICSSFSGRGKACGGGLNRGATQQRRSPGLAPARCRSERAQRRALAARQARYLPCSRYRRRASRCPAARAFGLKRAGPALSRFVASTPVKNVTTRDDVRHDERNGHSSRLPRPRCRQGVWALAVAGQVGPSGTRCGPGPTRVASQLTTGSGVRCTQS
jgi:hypothetical protein